MKYPEKYRNVKARALLLSVGGGKVYHKVERRELVSAVFTGGIYAVVSLSDREVGQSHEVKIGNSSQSVTFDADDKALDPEHSGTVNG